MPWAMVGPKQLEQAGLFTHVKNDLLNHLYVGASVRSSDESTHDPWSHLP